MYKPEHFTLQEWIPAWCYQKMFPVYGDCLWLVLDPRILVTADRLRKRYGQAIMNTWFSHSMMENYGRHEWRGYRDFNCPLVKREDTDPYGNVSQHRFGRAGDLVFLEHSAEEIRQDILADPFHPDFKHITCMEAGTSWLHIDVRNHDKKKHGIKIVNA